MEKKITVYVVRPTDADKHGVLTAVEDGKSKVKKTMIVVFGVDNFSKFSEFLEKNKKINVYKYGIEYDRWSPDSSEEYEGNGVWHIRLAAKCTNQYGAVENVIIDARVDFIKEAVTEFNVE